MKEITKPIQIIIDAVRSDSYFTGTIRKGYGTSARINVPPRLEGKKFILVVIEEKTEV